MKRTILFALSLMLSVFLIACSSKVTQENFDKISNDMTITQVQKILGKPSEQRHVEIGALSATSATWRHKGAVITIQFLDDKVTFKNFSKGGTHKLKIN